MANTKDLPGGNVYNTKNDLFSLFSLKDKKNKKEDFYLLLKKDSLSSYLAGLFEGDGHIWISKNNANAKKKA